MTDLGGITVTPGIMPSQLKESLAETVNRIGAKLIDSVRIDTTHFVCTEPRGQAWEKAVEMNVPVVVPDWVKGCEREGRIVGVRGYYLDADPKLRQMGPSQAQQRLSVSSAHQGTPRIEHTPPTPERSRATERRQEQDTPGSNTEPPTPPPKTAGPPIPERESIDEESEDTETEGDTSVVRKEISDDDDDNESEDDETSRTSREQGSAASNPAVTKEKETTDREAEAVAEEDGKFDEVAL